MKVRPILVVLAMLCAVAAAPALASAQTIHSEAEFQRYLANHPQLQANPSLMSDPAYLAHHPNLALFLHDHPGIHNQARAMGAYDTGHQWRDANWWYGHDPRWVHENHPEWWGYHPEWHPYALVPAPVVVGDYDEHHHWHDRGWWVSHNDKWVRAHHPHWDAEVYEHEHDHDHDHH
ncbi:MAG TPA: hypothetical protein VIX59_08680 [Candidatus Binataceae bacterium]